MAQIRCGGCGNVKDIWLEDVLRFSTDAEKLRGTVICDCGSRTTFELTNNVVTFIASTSQFIPPYIAPMDAIERFNEAKTCFFAQAFRAAAVMLRSSMESSLKAKGIDKGILDDRIDEALSKKLFSAKEYALAHASRLIGNEAIHEAQTIDPVDVQILFGAVTQLTNRLFT